MAEAQARSNSLNVWLVEDADLFRDATAALIEQAPDMSCPLAVPDCETALAALDHDAPPDILLMDIGLPGLDGIAGTRAFVARSPATRVIMLTVHEESDNIFAAICAGATGYLLKPSTGNEIVTAIRQVAAGAAPINGYIARKLLTLFSERFRPGPDYALSTRETEILEQMVAGLTMKQIADRVHLSYHTIDTHIRNIYGKLHVHSRSAAVAKALQERLV